jgi:hypothetical protein
MLLSELGISVEEFKTVIDAGPTDEDVLQALRALRRSKGLEEPGDDSPGREGERDL